MLQMYIARIMGVRSYTSAEQTAQKAPLPRAVSYYTTLNPSTLLCTARISHTVHPLNSGLVLLSTGFGRCYACVISLLCRDALNILARFGRPQGVVACVAVLHMCHLRFAVFLEGGWWQQLDDRVTDTARGRHVLCQHGGFSGPLLPHMCMLSVPRGENVGYIRKALQTGYLEHLGSACCADDMFDIFVRFC